MFVLWPNKSDGVVWMREELERFRKIYGKTFLSACCGRYEIFSAVIKWKICHYGNGLWIFLILFRHFEGIKYYLEVNKIWRNSKSYKITLHLVDIIVCREFSFRTVAFILEIQLIIKFPCWNVNCFWINLRQ